MSAGSGCLHNKAFRSHQRRCITLAVVTILCCGKLLSWAVVSCGSQLLFGIRLLCLYSSAYAALLPMHRSLSCTSLMSISNIQLGERNERGSTFFFSPLEVIAQVTDPIVCLSVSHWIFGQLNHLRSHLSNHTKENTRLTTFVYSLKKKHWENYYSRPQWCQQKHSSLLAFLCVSIVL